MLHPIPPKSALFRGKQKEFPADCRRIFPLIFAEYLICFFLTKKKNDNFTLKYFV